MIRRILVPLDTSEFTNTALEYAKIIAVKHQASLTGFVVLDVPGIEKSIGPAPIGGLYWAERLEKVKLEQANRRIEELLDHFRRFCEKNGLPHGEEKEQGSPSERIIEFSYYYDLVVLGSRTHFEFGEEKKEGQPVHDLMNHGITPFLAVPEHYRQIEKVLIAFDGSPAAARALQRFSHLAMNFDFEFRLLMSHEDPKIADYYLDRAVDYLKDYGATKVRKEWTARPIIEAVKDEFFSWPDLFVVGAHSKQHLLDFFVGSLTKFLLEEADRPVFVGL